MDAAFAAIRIDIELLEIMLSARPIDLGENSCSTAEEPLKHLCQQCEASLQFLQTMCQEKLFKCHLLKHKVLVKSLFFCLLDKRSINSTL